MEILGFKFKSNAQQNTIATFINGSTVLDLNNDIVDKTIAIRQIKKNHLPDAIIAATAIVFGFTLITRNVKDFRTIEGIKLLILGKCNAFFFQIIP